MNNRQRLPVIANTAVVSRNRKSKRGVRTLQNLTKTQRTNKKKKGKKNAARRPQAYRASRPSGYSRSNTNNNERLTSDTVREILGSRKGNRDDLSARELDELMDDANVVEPTAEKEERLARLLNLEAKTVENTKVPLYGNLRVNEKDPDAIRVMSININGIQLWKHNNIKAARLKHILKDYGVDVLGIQETNTNFAALKASHTLASVLRHGADEIRSVHSHNTRETQNIGTYQPGGTAVVVREQLTGFIKDRGKDERELGMFSWYSTEGKDGFKTVFISAYAPCSAPGSSTYYQHMIRYIQEQGLNTNPKDLFRYSVVHFIQSMRAKKHRIVLMMDSNENVVDGFLSKRLAEGDIRMREAVHRAMPGKKGPPTHFKGSQSIDGIWISDELELISASYLPFDGDLGDHRPVVIDLHMRSVLGTLLHRIVPPKARRLNSKCPRIRDEYLALVRKGFKEKNIERRLVQIEETATFPPTEEVEKLMEKLDNLIEEIMLQSEKGCRRLYAAHYEFSPPIQLWLDRCHLLKWLLRSHQGKQVNAGNMRRFARKLGMMQCIRMPVAEIVQLYREAKERTKDLMAESPYLRKQFLYGKLNDAIDTGRDQEAKRIQEVLRNEAQRKMWQGIHRATKPRGLMSVTRVEVPQEDGSVIEHTTKETIEHALMSELSTRFGRAESAPICQGALFDLLGVYADTEAAIQILEGTFDPPPDSDARTVVLLKEIARIWQKIGEGEVSIAISQEDYQHYWRRVKEKISSSFSGLHFGHYKSIAHDDYLSDLLARKLSLISATGAAPERWARGLSVMLEKIAGVAYITKLRAILLLEADFNFHNKLIFGSRMLDLARQHDLVPEEIYNEKGRTAEDAILQQVLMYDIARVTKRPLVVAQVDAAQCYDRVALAMAALTLRAFKVHNSSVLGMLKPLHCMEFYLRTGFGQSESYFGGKEQGKHGLAQGNGAAPPTWQQISTIMINAQHSKGHGVDIVCPITMKKIRQVGIAYVDDTNLWDGMAEDDDVDSAAHKSQAGINDWGGFLQASGGALNPGKCSATIHNLEPDGKGGWIYPDQKKEEPSREEEAEGEELDDLPFFVPQGDNDAAQIKRLSTDHAVENLGLYTRPDGKSDNHFEQMRERVTTWTAQIKSGTIPTRSVWMSYTHQLWAGLRYGLGACSASMTNLSKGLGSADYYLLSNLGVVRSITREWRYLPASFGGMHLFDLTIETTAATLSSLLQHYNMDTALGITLKAAMEHLQLELGVPGCPFDYDFSVWGHLATDSWVKALWERIDKFGIVVKLDYHTIPTPREHDIPIMQLMVDKGLRGTDLKRVNRARIAQEALFLSDITTATGRHLEAHLLDDWWFDTSEGELGKHRSTLQFSTEFPTVEDWKLWKKILKTVASTTLFLNQPLGRWVAPSTRIWRHFFHPQLHIAEVHFDDRIRIYEHDIHSSDRSWILTYTRSAETSMPGMVPAVLEELQDGKLRKRSDGQPLWNGSGDDDNMGMSFLDRLKSKGGEWMWETLEYNAEPDWIFDAMIRGSLYCVTDGSYNASLATDICGAAWIFYCSETSNCLQGEFAEQSESADSYRGEQLGMLAIHLVLATMEEHYGEIPTASQIYCDNKGTIQTFSRKHKRVSATVANNDILRVLRRIQGKSKLHHRIQHVKAHQDDHFDLHMLDLEEQLNYNCDLRAKRAVKNACSRKGERSSTIYSLPMESAAVYIEGEKQTTDIAKALRYHIGKANARRFYADEKIMDNETFDSVTWEDLRNLLQRRPKMYQLWYGKQCSGFCGVGAMVSRWDKNESSKCPNCGVHETADHLNRCSNKIRRALLSDSLRDLIEWMEDHDTDPELTSWLPLYLQKQGHKLFVDLIHPARVKMNQRMRQVGHSLDKIGWRHVTEGKLSMALRSMQADYLRQSHTDVTIDNWMRGLIDQLLTLSHTQWLCRNLTKHHRTKGAKALATKEDIRKEIELQLDMGADSLPAESRCLLEISPHELFGMDTSKQQYWLNAVVAARSAAAYTTTTQTQLPRRPLTLCQTALPQRSLAASSTPVTASAPSNERPTKRRKSTQPRSGPTHPDILITSRSRSLLHDKLNVLHRNTADDLQGCSIVDLLRHPRSTNLDLSLGRETVSHRSFKTLNPAIWLTDEVINGFLLKVLHPTLRNSNCYFYSSFFFSKLLSTGTHGTNAPCYQFEEVKRWGSQLRRRNGILGLKELYVPINHQQGHWLFLRAQMDTKVITLWDSQGRKEENQLYLQSMLRYLGDVYRSKTGQDQVAWKREWELIDDSVNSPRQHNGHDCGVFVITNITLLAQKIPLTVQTYTEATFLERNTRERIALLLWLASHNRPRPPTPQRQRRQAMATGTATKSTVKRGKKSTVKPSTTSSATKARQKRRRRNNNQRIILGGSRPKGIVHSSDTAPSAQLASIVNRKRSAISVAEGDAATQNMTQRHAPPKKKKRKIQS